MDGVSDVEAKQYSIAGYKPYYPGNDEYFIGVQYKVEFLKFIAVAGIKKILEAEPEAGIEQVIKQVVKVNEHPDDKTGKG